MAEDYDARLLESAKVRKHKLDDALLFGLNTLERSYASNTMKLMYSLLIATLVAAACVGFSFVQNLLSEQAQQPNAIVSSTQIPGSIV